MGLIERGITESHSYTNVKRTSPRFIDQSTITAQFITLKSSWILINVDVMMLSLHFDLLGKELGPLCLAPRAGDFVRDETIP